MAEVHARGTGSLVRTSKGRTAGRRGERVTELAVASSELVRT